MFLREGFDNVNLMVDNKILEKTARIKSKPLNVPVKAPSFFSRFWMKLLGQAKKAKATVAAGGGLVPLLSLETRVGLPKLKQLIDMQADRFVSQTLPMVKDKTVLEIGEGVPRFQKIIMERKPKAFCGIFVDDVSLKVGADSPLMMTKGSFKGIPFEEHFFDCVVARVATPHQGDVVTAFKEISRTLMPDGTALVLDFHPFGLYAKTGTPRLRSHQSTIRGLEDYFKMCRVAGLSVVDLHEGFLDDTVRNQFVTPGEMNAFRELKGTPLVLFLVVTKPGVKPA